MPRDLNLHLHTQHDDDGEPLLYVARVTIGYQEHLISKFHAQFSGPESAAGLRCLRLLPTMSAQENRDPESDQDHDQDTDHGTGPIHYRGNKIMGDARVHMGPHYAKYYNCTNTCSSVL